jgi:Flp pilus assembly protein TadD
VGQKAGGPEGREDVEVFLDFGELLMDMGEMNEAGRVLRQILPNAEDNPSVHFCLGELAIRQKINDVAERHFRRLLELDDLYPGAHLKLAEALIRGNQPQEGAKHLVLELRHRGKDVEVLREAGHLLLEARQSRQANVVFRRLVKLQPSDAHSQHNLAVSYFMMDRLSDGIRYCRRALKLKPDYPLALYNLALAHLQMGQETRARRYVLRALTIAPEDPNVRRLARRLSESGFWSRLRKGLRRDKQAPPGE